MKWSRLAWVLHCAWIAACADSQPLTPSDEPDAVLVALLPAIERLVEERDVEGYVAFLDRDFTVSFSASDVDDPIDPLPAFWSVDMEGTALRELFEGSPSLTIELRFGHSDKGWTDYFPHGPDGEAWKSIDVEYSVVVGFVTGADPETYRSRCTLHARKQDDEWKLVHWSDYDTGQPTVNSWGRRKHAAVPEFLTSFIHPSSLVANLMAAYDEKNHEELARLLHTRFQFQFSIFDVQDITHPVPDSWGREDELLAAEKMFLPGVSVFLGALGYEEWNETGDGTGKVAADIAYVFNVSANGEHWYTLDYMPARFIARPVSRDVGGGRTRTEYQLWSIADIPVDATTALYQWDAVHLQTWGSIKYQFYDD